MYLRRVDDTVLTYAEGKLLVCSPDDFDRADSFAFPECIEAVREVEDREAWKARYMSLDEFYAVHEARHPDIRLYGKRRREILTEDPLTAPGGLPSQQLARLRGDAS